MSTATMELTQNSDLSIETYLRNLDQQLDPHELQYRELVFAVGEGRESFTGDKESLVLATGRTIDTFSADVATYQRRLEASKSIASASALTAQIDQATIDHEKAVKDLAAFEEEFERFRAEQLAAIEARRTRLSDLNSQKLRSEQAANEVLKSSYDFALEDTARPYGHRLMQLREELLTVNNEVARHLNGVERSRNEHVVLNPGSTYEEAAKRFPDKTPEHYTTKRMSLDRQIR